MAVISNDRNVIELINVITVEPDDQQAIVDNVREILKNIAEKQPGFISSKVYKSLDRTRVAYFIRWRSQDDGLAWFEDIRDALKVARSRVKNADYHLYELIESISL
jgi:heme-degrading monooxygenase HmoA